MRASLLLLGGCYLLTDADLRGHDARLADGATTEDGDADTDADSDADTDADTDTATVPSEDGDTVATATVVTDSLEASGACFGERTLDPWDGDVDVFTFLGARAGDVVWVWTNAARLPDPSGLDTRLEVVDAGDVALATGNDLPFGRSLDSVVAAEFDGSVNVRVTALGTTDAADPRYEICAALAPVSEAEPNGSLDESGVPQVTVVPWDDVLVQAVGSSAYADADVYRFPTVAGDTSQWALVTGAHGLADPALWLFDEAQLVAGTAGGSAVEYDPRPLADGAPVDAAVMYRSEVGDDVFVQVRENSYALAVGWYVLLRNDLGDAFAGEVANDHPLYSVGQDPVEDASTGAWTFRQAGSVAPGDDDFVRMNVVSIPDLQQKTMSVWLQGASVGSLVVSDLQVLDADGVPLFIVPPDAVGDRVDVISLYGLPADPLSLQFFVPEHPASEAYWFLTVTIEP